MSAKDDVDDLLDVIRARRPKKKRVLLDPCEFWIHFREFFGEHLVVKMNRYMQDYGKEETVTGRFDSDPNLMTDHARDDAAFKAALKLKVCVMPLMMFGYTWVDTRIGKKTRRDFKNPVSRG